MCFIESSATLGGCPPGWYDCKRGEDEISGGDSCYTLKTHMETWTKAQRYCNYDQANLAAITSVQQADALTGKFGMLYVIDCR